MRGWMMAVLGLLLAGTAAAGGTVFDTAGHEKVSGVRIRVTYPEGFLAREHMDGYVVQEFTRKSGELEENLTLQVADVDEDEMRAVFPLSGSPGEKERHARLKQSMEQAPSVKVSEIRDVKADGRPAVLAAMSMTLPFGEEMHYLLLRTLNIYDNGRGIVLTCSVSGPEAERAAVEALYAASVKAACQPFFDSVRLLPEKP